MAKRVAKDVEASNTTSTTSSRHINSFSQSVPQSVLDAVICSGSVDYLEASVYVDWGETPQVCWAAEFLRSHRDAAEPTDKRFVVVPFKGRMIEVKGHGKRGPAIHYDVICQYKGITFEIAFRNWKKGKPNLSVSAKSLTSMSLGIYEFMAVVSQMIADLGGRLVFGTWKRLDLAVDFAGIGVTPFCQAYEAGHYIARASSGAVHLEGHEPEPGESDEEDEEVEDGDEAGEVHHHRRRYSGFSHGGGIKLRVYDKVLEATGKKADPEKLAFLQANRFHGRQEVTRVEFQLRGSTLRQVSLQKWSDTERMLEVMATWLASKWFRMSECHDRTHSSRAKVLPIWDLVQRGFSQVYGQTQERPKRVKAKPGHMRRLVLQAFGLLASAGAAMSGVTGPAVSYDDICAAIRANVPDDFVARVNVKRVQRGADLVEIGRGDPDPFSCLDGEFS